MVSQALTLYTIPVTYLYMERLAAAVGRPRSPPRIVPHEHALVPANRHPPPARIYKDAAE